jgi:hypothetical protein
MRFFSDRKPRKGDGEWLPGSLPIYVAHLAEGQY